MPEKNLRSKIEKLRRIMHLLAREKGISHPDVLKASILLDKKLNQYHRSASLEPQSLFFRDHNVSVACKQPTIEAAPPEGRAAPIKS